ncbi:MAG TPA: YtxH domain-containing protein [Kiritimatiellia bacterium]|nr:YtxH domain-containing protein [Kiritimatiellia bacterium]HMO98018.1 YtxH domain-containing protein [Kiritimatiellia bacterium]HMP97469.1 YtxH domain-containing protein [Kiritimatiellia bacterium]
MSTTLRILIGAFAGALVGYLMYRYIGCRTGACPLTANPYTSILIYALFGALILGGK